MPGRRSIRRAKLLLRGPDNPYKNQMIELARSKGLLDRSVFFPKAVSEADLVKAARDADVGIIPYEPTIINHRFCSPNKLSQYMAAGLPIICNELDFVKSVVLGYSIGSSVDFNDQAALVRTINEYVQKRIRYPSSQEKRGTLLSTSSIGRPPVGTSTSGSRRSCPDTSHPSSISPGLVKLHLVKGRFSRSKCQP